MFQFACRLFFVRNIRKRVETENLPVNGNIYQSVQPCKTMVDVTRTTTFSLQVKFVLQTEIFCNVLKGYVILPNRKQELVQVCLSRL